MRTVTIEQVFAWKPCPDWTEKRIREMAGGKKEMSAVELAALPISAADRLWLLLHEELIPAAALHELGCMFAERALMREREAGREPDVRSWEAIAVKRSWLVGEANDEELAAARNAARDAVCDAARAPLYAAWSAARAARDADCDAVCDARYAARAACDAARDADYAAETDWQLKESLLVARLF